MFQGSDHGHAFKATDWRCHCLVGAKRNPIEVVNNNLVWLGTPRKFNMEPENHPLEKEKHLPNPHVWVPC